MFIRETLSVQLRVIKIIKHRVSRSGFHGGTRRGLLQVIYFLFLYCYVINNGDDNGMDFHRPVFGSYRNVEDIAPGP